MMSCLEKFPIEKFIVTKSLRAYYKDPERIAHKVLADRMGERDPGNKPKSNDRIPYVSIESPDFTVVTETRLKLDDSDQYGKYLVVYETPSGFVVHIDTNFMAVRTSDILLKAKIRWDWDNKKDRGFNILYSTNQSLLQKLSSDRRGKLPIATFESFSINKCCEKVRFLDNPEKMNVYDTVMKICDKMSKTKQNITFTINSQLFERKEKDIKKKTLQGERIEHPDYIISNNLNIDYKWYITNQIMKPVCQIYALKVENLDKKYNYPHPPGYYEEKFKSLMEAGKTEDKAVEKIRSLRENMAAELLFTPIIQKIEAN